MTLTELPSEDPTATRRGRKRVRAAAAEPSQLDVVVPPINVDRDLLLQVVRTKVRALIRCRREQEQQAGEKTDDPYQGKCTADRLEKLLPVIEQRWLQELLRGDQPRYGFDEVVKVFQDILHAEDRESKR